MRRIMKHNDTTGTPSNHVVFDCETFPTSVPDNPNRHCHRLRLGVARAFRVERGKVCRRSELVFRTGEEARRFLLSRVSVRNPLWIWAHSAGFDLTAIGFWELFESGELRLNMPAREVSTPGGGTKTVKERPGMFVSMDPPTIIRAYTPGGATVWAADTLNWFMEPLTALGDAVGLPKLAMPADAATDEEWLTYCRRDCEILERVVVDLLSFVRDYDCGNFRATAAGQSVSLFRHRCMTCDITIDDRVELKALEREAYYGGRREVYFRGFVASPGVAQVEQLAGVPAGVPTLLRGPVYQLDLTAAYPSVMAGNLYPVRYHKSRGEHSPGKLRDDMAAFGACAHVRLNCQMHSFPVRSNGRVIQAIGRFGTTLCGPELLRALESNNVEHVHSSQLYSLDRPFDEFVRAGWEMRQSFAAEGRKLYEKLAKHLMNSLHGKFGQRMHKWDLLPGLVAPMPWGSYTTYDCATKAIQIRRSIGGQVQQQNEQVEKADSSPVISAYATAYCRERMHRLRATAGRRNTLYEDADSLHVTQEGFANLDRAGECGAADLGRLRTVRVGASARYVGPKDYQIDDVVVMGGVSRKAVEDDAGRWHQTDFARLDAVLSGPPPAGPLCEDRTLERPVHPVSARITASGWTEPLELP